MLLQQLISLVSRDDIKQIIIGLDKLLHSRNQSGYEQETLFEFIHQFRTVIHQLSEIYTCFPPQYRLQLIHFLRTSSDEDFDSGSIKPLIMRLQTDVFMPVAKTNPFMKGHNKSSFESSDSKDGHDLTTIPSDRACDVIQCIEQFVLTLEESDRIELIDVLLIIQEHVENLAEVYICIPLQFRLHLNHCLKMVYEYFVHGDVEHISLLLEALGHEQMTNALSEDEAETLALQFKSSHQEEPQTNNTQVSKGTSANLIDSFEPAAEAIAVDRELVDMLSNEIDSYLDEINQLQFDVMDSSAIDILEKFRFRNECFGDACQAAELHGLHQACQVMDDNYRLIMTSPNLLTDTLVQYLKSWPEIIKLYLAEFNRESSSLMCDFLTDTTLPEAMLQDLYQPLHTLLNAPYIQNEARQEQIQQAISDDELELKIPDDINSDLLEGLLYELPGQISELTAAIQTSGEAGNVEDNMRKARRIAHTIKGSSNIVGIKALAYLTHRMEDVFDVLSNHALSPGAALADSLLTACDCLQDITDFLMEEAEPPSNIKEVFSELSIWLEKFSQDSPENVVGEAPSNEQTTSPEPDNTLNVEKHQAKEREEDKTIRVSSHLIDEVIRLMGESMILNTQLTERVSQLDEHILSLKKQSAMMQELSNTLGVEIELDAADTLNNNHSSTHEDFDPLELQKYNEVHSINSQIAEAVNDGVEINNDAKVEVTALNEFLNKQSQLQHELQDLVMKTRMVKAGTITSRLQRICRQTCRTLGKEVQLTITGEDTPVDSNILNHMVDPLMHILRNCIDHGIEEPSLRSRLQKSDTGNVSIRFLREGTKVLIQIEDDGAGLDKQAIVNKAISSKLITQEESTLLDEQAIFRLIFHTGFSTSHTISQISGRGLGMDIVLDNITKINGVINISSEYGKGTLFELSLPQSLISTQAFFCTLDGNTFAIASHGITQILHQDDCGSYEIARKAGVKRINGKQYDVESFAHLLKSRQPENMLNQLNSGILVEDSEVNAVVYLEEIESSKTIVVKKNGMYLQKIHGVLGVTILGDGEVVPVINLPDLIRTKNLAEEIGYQGLQTITHVKLPSVLVIDDSLSARRALAQVVKDTGYEVLEAKDGLEAIAVMEEMKKPDVIIVDFEMPRMNGIEFTTHVRASHELDNIPIIMITSRSTDKHKNLAFQAGVNTYLTKPFSEDELVDLLHEAVAVDNLQAISSV